MPLISCEVFLTFTWSGNSVITSKAARDADPDADPAVAAINNTTGATFKIRDTKWYVPVVSWSTEDDSKILEQFKPGFKRTIQWNKKGAEMTNQVKTNNLNFLIDPTYNKVDRLLSNFRMET